MVDLTTLPRVETGNTVPLGQRFIVKGDNFDKWPNELVLGYKGEDVLSERFPSYAILKLISKSNTELTFESVREHEFSTAHVFNVFGSPFDTPRTILDYNE